MGRFSKKKNSEEIYDELAQKVILSAFEYRADILEEVDNKQSVDVGAEIVYFLMHLIDILSFQLFNVEKRNEIYDAIYKRVLTDYCRSALSSEAPLKLFEYLTQEMLKTLNERQEVYSECISMTKEFPFPRAGTIYFALSFFIYKALGKTNREDVYDILSGDEYFKKSDFADFPDIDKVMSDYTFITNIIMKSKISELIKGL